MALSFSYFISSIQIFSETIIETLKTLVDDILFQNNFFNVMCICVRGPTLARLATVSVLLSIGNSPALRIITNYYSPLRIWQRAVNRQPDSRANNS